MKSPRRFDLTHPALQKDALNNETKPPEDSISWRLWLAGQAIAQDALNTDYVQGIRQGNLDPNDYGQYTIQDCTYCAHAQDDYLTIEQRARNDSALDLASFAKARYDSYVKYTNEQLTAWHIKSPSALAPSPAAQTYIDFEHQIATTYPPIYGVLAMIPCDQLWPWLAEQLNDQIKSSGIYSFWIKENIGFTGAYRLDNFIDAWFAQYPEIYNWERALYVYQSCLTCELNFFKSACGQALSPMPTAPKQL
ncbi:MAG: TenA family transcriptional regulator [Cyanobacteria bacterium P01_G01_bin.54]